MKSFSVLLIFSFIIISNVSSQSTLTDQEIADICQDSDKCEEFFLNWEQESFKIAMKRDWDLFIKETKRISRLAEEYGQLEISRNVMAGVYETQYMLRDYEGALQTVDSLLSLEGLTDSNRQAFLYRAGTLYNHKEAYDIGIPMMKEAIELTPKDDSLFLPTVYSDLARTYSKIGKNKEAINYLLKALDMEVRDQTKATRLLNISNLYNSMGQQEKSIDYFEKAEALYDKQRNDYFETLMVQKALIHLHKNEFDTAEIILSEIKSFMDTAQLKNPDHYYLLVLAELQGLKGDLTGMKISLNQIDTSNFYQSFKKLYYTSLWSEYYIQSGDLYQARQHMKNYGAAIASSNDVSAIQKYLAQNIKLEKKLGNYQKALEFTDTYHQRADSIYRSGQEDYVLELGEKYESEKKQMEIDQLNAENQVVQLELNHRNRLILFVSILLALATIFSIAFYRLFKRTKISERSLAKANEEKAVLLKEIHHRVKNNLQVVSSLLTLQSKYVDDDTALDAINTGKSRVQSMSILHRNLYQNENLKNIKIKPYFDDLVENLVNTYKVGEKTISIKSEVDDIEVDVDTVIPMGLITNELISNALKYAFQEKDLGKINLKIKEANGILFLSVSDDGIGIPFTEIPRRSKTLGMQLIHSFSKKLKADIEIENNNGTMIQLSIPVNTLKQRERMVG